MKLNNEKRNDIRVDKIFLKALVIGVCTLQRINQLSTPFEDGQLDFVKRNTFSLIQNHQSIENTLICFYCVDLFEIRVTDDDINGLRLSSFSRLLLEVMDEIRHGRI